MLVWTLAGITAEAPASLGIEALPARVVILAAAALLAAAGWRARRLVESHTPSAHVRRWRALGITLLTLAALAAASVVALPQTGLAPAVSAALPLGLALAASLCLYIAVELCRGALAGSLREREQLREDLASQQTTVDTLRESEAAVADANANMVELYAELETLHTRALDATRAKTEFLAHMSHELRTPLNAVIGFAELLEREDADEATRAEYVEIILRSGRHLLHLINDILEMSKIEAGKLTLDEAPFDLHDLLQTTSDMFRARARDKGIYMKLDRDGALPRYVRGDAKKLRQTLVNLVGNAVKFTERGGVTLCARSEARGDRLALRFEVIDTGIGIAPSDAARMFEPFTQAEAGRRRETGTGLGLAISREFIRVMGGELTLESELGLGSTFRFELVAPAAPSPRAATTAGRITGLPANAPTYRVLLAEDHPINRALLVHLLTPLGFELREATNGREAVRICGEWSPHLIFMDIQMPVMNGYDATRQIKAERAAPPKIIALTANAFERERAAIEAAGCDGFISKPFEANALLEEMGAQLDIAWERASEPARRG